MRALWDFLTAFIFLVAAIGTIAASGIAIWVFVTKRREIHAFVRTITTFVHQNSMAELRFKLEKLNYLSTNDPEGRAEVIAVFHDICGQIDGSPVLKPSLSELGNRMRDATSRGRSLTEPKKRFLVAELREKLRHLDVANHTDALRDEQE